MKLSDYVIQFIADLGVRHVFMLPGGGCMHLVDSLGRHPEVAHVANLHEQASAIAADAYAQYTNGLGVALVTTGPGGTNAVTGVAGAWLDSTPCLFLSGQVKRADLRPADGPRQVGFQEIDIVSVVAPLTKYAVTVTDPATIREHLERAVHLARTGRPGPVWIDLPLDVQAAEIDPAAQAGYAPPAPAGHAADLEAQAAEALRLLLAAERPVILVGNGVRLAGAQARFLALAESLGVPVLTTWKAMDFLPETHPLYVGRPGAVGQRAANFAQQNADWIMTLGARLDFGQTGYAHENFARAARKVMVDVDPSEIAKMRMPIDVPVAADAGDFLAAFAGRLDPGALPDWSAWRARCQAWKAAYPLVSASDWAQGERVNNYVLLEVLSEAMTGDDLLIPGSSGACSEITMQAFKVKAGMRVFNTEGLGPMGFGIPAALGGCLASGGRRTVCIDGDGGFVMNLQELETVRRLNLPIKFFVLNNEGYGSIRNSQRNYFDGFYVASEPGSGLTLPDVRRVAEAFGLPTARLEGHEGLAEQVRAVLETPGPVVCEVMIAPDQATAPRITSAQLPDGTMVSRPLEDMWPLLDREEFRRNMLVPTLHDVEGGR